MNSIVAAIGRWFNHLRVFVIIQPWEQGLLVRRGRSVRLLAPGVHARVPIIDEVYRQSIRMRTVTLSLQTVSTADGVTLTIGAALGYTIGSIERLYATLHHAEDTLAQMASSAIARSVYSAAREHVTPESVVKAVTAELNADFSQFGLTDVSVRLTDFAFVRAYRLVMDQRWVARQTDGLSTVSASDVSDTNAANTS